MSWTKPPEQKTVPSPKSLRQSRSLYPQVLRAMGSLQQQEVVEETPPRARDRPQVAAMGRDGAEGAHRSPNQQYQKPIRRSWQFRSRNVPSFRASTKL